MRQTLGDPVPQHALDRQVGALPFFVLGWREVFVPLAVMLHNQHGPAVALAGLAVAATRLGGWLHAKGTFKRRPREAAILGGIALLLLGLAPEEGPVALLLWFVFGVTWPILHEALAATLWQGWASLAVLVAGMIAAGPLASGPGTWLIAGCFFFLAWRLGPLVAKGDSTETGPPTRLESPSRLLRQDALPFLFSFASLIWIWLVPSRLIDQGAAPSWFGIVLAASWAARPAGAWVAARLPNGVGQMFSGLGLLVSIGVAALASAPWQLAAGLAIYGVSIGMIGARDAIERPELGGLPGRAQALGEVLGPLAGVAVLVLGGSPAVFAAAALASIALTIATLVPSPTPDILIL